MGMFFVRVGAAVAVLCSWLVSWAIPVEITDFREPHPWNKQVWRVSAGSFSNGTWTVEYAGRPFQSILNSVDIPFVPSRYHLTVEFSARAAGANVSLIIGQKDTWLSKMAGELRAPLPGEDRIRQTIDIDGDLSKGWKWEEHGSVLRPKWPRLRLPSRLIGFWIHKNKALAESFDVRFVSLTADPITNSVAPMVRMVPVGDKAPPNRVFVRICNTTGRDVDTAELDVVESDWDGHRLGEVSVPVRALRVGECRVVEVRTSAIATDKNYVKYVPMWKGHQGGADTVGVGSCWTRPLTGEGTRELRPDLPWGMNIALSRKVPGHSMTERAALARQCGIKWDRTGMSPAEIRPSRDVWAWERIDGIVDLLHANGISVYGLVSGFPKWVNPYTEEAYVEYLSVLKAMAERYRGKVRGWEIWNEPNIHFWKGPKADYFKLVDRSYGVIREVDPTVPVVALSAAAMPNTLSFVKEFFSTGARFSDISIHTYGNFPELKFLKSMDELSAMAGGHKVWVSEMGWTTGEGADGGEQRQASLLARLFMTVAGSGSVKVVNWYDFVDDGFNPCYVEEAFGIVRRDMTPKPACRACATVCGMFTTGTPSLKNIGVSATENVWEFHMGGRSAIWTDADDERVVSFEGMDRFAVYNLMGERMRISPEIDGVPVSGCRPVIVDGMISDIKVR